MIENWKSCNGYPNYEVSDLGRVRSLDHLKWCGPAGYVLAKGKILKPAIGSHGYPYVQLGKGNVRTVHSLVLENFDGPAREGFETRHLDGNKLNARLSNLMWGTPKDNGADKITHGTAKIGAMKAAETVRRKVKYSMKHTVEEMTRAGCTTPRGVRHWEDIGLLGKVERTSGGMRRYSPEQLDKAKIIAAAQFGNFSLDVIKGMLEEWDNEVYEAIIRRLFDQSRAAIKLAENLPKPPNTGLEFDL